MSFPNFLAYMLQSYSEAMVMRPSVSYIPYATYLKEQTGDIMAFAQFEEGNLLSEYHNSKESSDKSDDNLTLPPLISEA